MTHKRQIKPMRVSTILTAALLMLAGCSTATAGPKPESDTDEGKVLVVTSFTILENMVQEMGGDLVRVHNLVPTGTDPHEYEPLPADLRATAAADVLFFNGLNLEGGPEGWFNRLTTSVGQPESKIFEVSTRITPQFLGEAGSREEEINPHGFTDPNNGILMAEAILAGLQAVDPQNKDTYQDRANNYIEQIKTIERDYAEKLGAVPEGERIMVTSERAFQYLAKRYNITEAFLWEVDTEENGSVEQLKNLVDYLRANPVQSLIVESNVDPRPMQTVADETKIPIYGAKIYSDEIGDADDPEANTYLKYLRHNLEIITGAMTQ